MGKQVNKMQDIYMCKHGCIQTCRYMYETASPLSKEILAHATTWMSLEDNLLISQSQKDKYIWSYLSEYPEESNLEKAVVAAKGWGTGENEELLFRVHGVSIWKDEKSFGDAWWWSHNVTMLMPLKYTLKKG